MDMNLLSGSIGMPSYHFFKQHGAVSTQTLAASALKQSNEERNDRHLEARARARSALPNEERAENSPLQRNATCMCELDGAQDWKDAHYYLWRRKLGESPSLSLARAFSHARAQSCDHSVAPETLNPKP
jgi:hypothetical protein